MATDEPHDHEAARAERPLMFGSFGVGGLAMMSRIGPLQSDLPTDFKTEADFERELGEKIDEVNAGSNKYETRPIKDGLRRLVHGFPS